MISFDTRYDYVKGLLPEFVSSHHSDNLPETNLDGTLPYVLRYEATERTVDTVLGQFQSFRPSTLFHKDLFVMTSCLIGYFT
jgi:hypothetical protein